MTTAGARRYRRAVRRAFHTVPFYREQWATAGVALTEPMPVPTGALPEYLWSLVPYQRGWRPERDVPLTRPDPAALARALRLAGCGGRRPVLEVRDALLDVRRLPGWPGRRYGVLLSTRATVASATHRHTLNKATLDRYAGPVWLVGAPDDLAEFAGPDRHPVHRIAPAAIPDATFPDAYSHSATAGDGTAGDGGPPVLLHDPTLGYLGARQSDCGRFHLDTRRVYAAPRPGGLAFSLLGRRRPALLAILPPGADRITIAACPRHGSPVILPR